MPELQPFNNNNNLPASIFKPSELLKMFAAFLSQLDANHQLVYLRGIYMKSPRNNPQWAFRYDELRDEDSQTTITLQMTHQLSENLNNGNLVTVGGVLDRRVQNNGNIQLLLVVSRIEVVQEQVVDETELKRVELRRKKSSIGFKNVDSILEQKLFADERPKVVLVFATTSITMSDFNAGINAAKSAIDFFECRVNFSSSSEFSSTLKRLDTLGYDVIALVRGGGAKVEAADDLGVLETVVNMKTPIIAAIGHVEEKLFIKQIVDKEAPTPNGLGQYFSEMVEAVSEKKSKSLAALTEKIKKQFQDQLEAGKKQTEKANKQNEDLQKKITEITNANKAAQKTHAEELGKLREQMKTQAEANSKQSKDFNESLKKLQETNTSLNKTVQQLTAQNAAANAKTSQLEKQLSEANGNPMWMIIAIIAIIVLVVVLIFK